MQLFTGSPRSASRTVRRLAANSPLLSVPKYLGHNRHHNVYNTIKNDSFTNSNGTKKLNVHESPKINALDLEAEITKARTAEIASHYEAILGLIGEDPKREGLLKTPQRAAKAIQFLTHGYGLNLSKVTNNAIFHEITDEMIVVKDIEYYSLCEHHLIPFFGVVHVAYYTCPTNKKIIGLSKLARIVDMYARRLQTQERLTNQIANAVSTSLDALGVAVSIESSHLCMAMRGVQKQCSKTVTSCMLGKFEDDYNARNEFLNFIKNNGNGNNNHQTVTSVNNGNVATVRTLDQKEGDYAYDRNDGLDCPECDVHSPNLFHGINGINGINGVNGKNKINGLGEINGKNGGKYIRKQNNNVANGEDEKIEPVGLDDKDYGDKDSMATVEIRTQDMKFSCGHFTIFNETEREMIHGNNYQVSCEVTGNVDKNTGMILNYQKIKNILCDICSSWDKRFLIAGDSPYLKCIPDELDNTISIYFNNKFLIKILENEVNLLPVRNITCEELSPLILKHICDSPDLEDSINAGDVKNITVKITPHNGQSVKAFKNLINPIQNI